MDVVAASFRAFAKHEIAYRKNDGLETELTPEMVLQYTIDTCVVIAKRGRGSDNEKTKFKELQKGIIAFGSGFLMDGNFRIDDAVSASARIAYLAAKIKVNDLSSIVYYNSQDIKDVTIQDPDWNFLNKLKKQPDKSAFFYWFKTIELISNKKTSEHIGD